MYFDINNNGDKLLHLYDTVKEQVDMSGAVIYFEGGSEERDKFIKSDSKKMNDVKLDVGYEVLTSNTKYSVSRIS